MIGDIRESTGHGIRSICAALAVPRSSYHHAARPTPTRQADIGLGEIIGEIFMGRRRRYGYRQVRPDPLDRGIICAPARIRRLMAERGLRAIQPKTYVPKTSDGRADRPSPNLLAGRPLPGQPDRVWAGDITFVPTAAGWRYPAVIIELCSRHVVGWAFADHMRADLVTEALGRALCSRNPRSGLVFHSDRGSQYGSGAYRRMLAAAGIVQSMSARANPYHNAWTESLIGTLKNEMLRGGEFADEAGARLEIFDFIECYHNRHRKHSALDYRTAAQFEAANPSQN